MSEDRRCLVVDGHELVRMGVRELLDGRYEVEEAAGWIDVRQALASAGSFDVAIVEIDRPIEANGHPVGPEMIRALRRARPQIGIVAHARRPASLSASAALDAGARAFVAKSSPPRALELAVDAVAGSGRFVDPAAAVGDESPLTPRQREILQLVADGLSTADAAARLTLSAETIRTHTKAVLARLAARDRAHAVAIGLRTGLIE